MTDESKAAFDDLLRAAVAGDREAQGRLLAEHRAWLKVLAGRRMSLRLKNFHDPSDVVQDCLKVAAQQLTSFRGGTEGEFRAWLRGILRNLMFHVFRKDLPQLDGHAPAVGGDREFDPAADQSSVDGQVIQQHLLARLDEAIGELRPEDRRLVMARYLRDTDSPSYGDLAVELGDSAVNLRKRLERLRRQLYSGIELLDALDACRVPPHSRRAACLIFFQKRSVDEISTAMNWAPKATRAALDRARSMLPDAWKDKL